MAVCVAKEETSVKTGENGKISNSLEQLISSLTVGSCNDLVPLTRKKKNLVFCVNPNCKLTLILYFEQPTNVLCQICSGGIAVLLRLRDIFRLNRALRA